MGWTDDSRAVIVNSGNLVPARIERIDVTAGSRTFLREVAPPDRGGVIGVSVSHWLDGEPGYVYDYARQFDGIFIVKEKQ